MNTRAPWGSLKGKTCQVAECGEPARAKGMCRQHYNKTAWAARPADKRPGSTQWRAAKIKQVYGISQERYTDMYAACKGACEACGRAGDTCAPRHWKYPLAIDHCHSTGAVRGLLCNECNTALGMLHDDEGRIRALLDYLGRIK